MQNIQVYTTHSLNGWTYGALNFHGLAACALENFGYGTAGTYAPNGPETGGRTIPSVLSLSVNVMKGIVASDGIR